MDVSDSTSAACAVGVLALSPLAFASDTPPAAAASSAPASTPAASAPAVAAASDAADQDTPAHLPIRLDLEHSPPFERYYPSAARHPGEGRSTRVFVCVAASGELTATLVDRSSGSKALDEAAVKWAADARYFPASNEGQAVAACASFRVRFHSDRMLLD